ncbi:MAG: hypothetical protein ACE5HP_03345 [Gemmatimonadota bacterium]
MNGPSALHARLEGVGLVHVDARVLGFHLVAESRFLTLTRGVFRGIRDGSIEAQGSSLSFYQLFCEPFRLGKAGQATEVAKLLSVYRGLEIVPVTPKIALQAAQVQAQLGGSMSRAVQVATGLVSGADIYLTEGSGLRRIAQMVVLNLEDYAGAE